MDYSKIKQGSDGVIEIMELGAKDPLHKADIQILKNTIEQYHDLLLKVDDLKENYKKACGLGLKALNEK
jgi:hypothetical protein